MIRAMLTAFCIGGLVATASAAEPLHDLVFSDTTGKAHRLASLTTAGTPVVFVYWQPWCGRCRKEAPEIAQAAAANAGRLQFFGVVAGTEEMIDDKQVQEFLAKANFTFPQVRDRELALTEEMHVLGTPTVIIVGKGNQVLYRGNGAPADWTRF